MQPGSNGLRVKAVLALVCVIVLSTTAWCQQSSKRTVVHAGKMLDVKTGNLLSDQAIVIEDGKIVSVGPKSAVKLSGSETLIELGSATVLPGLIDAHTHLTFNPQFGYDSLAISIPREALIGATQRESDVGGRFHHGA